MLCFIRYRGLSVRVIDSALTVAAVLMKQMVTTCPAPVTENSFCAYFASIKLQYKSLKVIQNGGKSKKSKTFFVTSLVLSKAIS